MNTAGQRINFIQSKLELNNKQLADLVGVSSSAIGRWHAMKELSPTVKRKVLKLQEAYNINIDWIETGDGEPFLDVDLNKSQSNSINQKFRAALEQIKKHYGTSFSSIAEKIGIDQNKITSIRHGRSSANTKMLNDLFAAFPEFIIEKDSHNVTVESLLKENRILKEENDKLNAELVEAYRKIIEYQDLLIDIKEKEKRRK